MTTEGGERRMTRSVASRRSESHRPVTIASDPMGPATFLSRLPIQFPLPAATHSSRTLVRDLARVADNVLTADLVNDGNTWH